jgi:hypothetical protein
VGTGVGEAQHHMVLGEQVSHLLGIVVGDVGPEARGEILGQRELAHHVEWAD